MTIAMANGREFRANGRFCSQLASDARMPSEREAWLKMKAGWLSQAVLAESEFVP